MKTLKILWLFRLEILEELLFNQLYIINNTHFLLLLCLKNKVTFEKLLKLRGGKMDLRGGEMPPLKPPKKNPALQYNYMHIEIHLCMSTCTTETYMNMYT